MKQKIKDKRAAILKTTLELITERGFHGTPMSMIADQSKVGAGTIYRYFKGKEHLINVLFRELKEEMDRAIFENYQTDLPIKTQFELVWKNVWTYYIQHPKVFKFMEQYYYSPFIDDKTKTHRSQLHEPITIFFEQLNASGKGRAFPIDVMYALTHGPIVSLAKFYLEDNVKFNEAIMKETIEPVWNSIALE